MKKHLLLTLAFVLAIVFQSNAQDRHCAAHEVHEEKLASNPDYAKKQQQIESATRKFVEDMKAGRVVGSNVVIPCIVHVVYANAQENISDAQVQSQIDRLNIDFAGTNPDISNTPSEFSIAGNTNIQFELIETKRYSNSRATWGTNDLVKSTYPPIEPERILNMWVADIGGGILGYAQFPGGALSTDGVVMSPQYFGDRSASGSGSFYLSAPYDLGRTATHEVGHWLNLRHIWGDGNCSADDFVSDTPTAAASNGGCPSYPSKSCTNNGGFSSDMFMNYMDYVEDACMYMFSPGQDARMQATFQSGGGRSGFLLDPVYNPGGGGGGPVACSSTVNSFPYSESFESGNGAWTQGTGDDLDWTRDSGGTPSSGTGPATGAAGSFYMFVEASSPNYPSKTTYLNSPCFNLSSASSASFSFGYHMNGTAVGTLKVQASTDGSSWSDVFSTSGSKGDAWQSATVNLASYTGDEVRLRFVGTTGSGWSSDIAIDNVSLTASGGVSCGVPSGLSTSNVTFNSFTISWGAVSGASSYDVEVNGSVVSDNTTGTSVNLTGAAANTAYSVKVRSNCSGSSSAYSGAVNVTTPSEPVSGACTGGVSSFPYSESFESGLGAWSQGTGDDNNWTRDSGGTPSSGTGPSTGSAGSWYMFLETSGNGTGFPNKTAYLNSPCFNLSSASNATFSFDYHMNGTAMGSLILQVSTNNGSSWSNAWSISGSQGDAWANVDVDFGAYAGSSVQARFLATSGSSWSSDIAVDNISVSTGSTGGGGGGNVAVTLTLVLDQYASETAWTLKNASGTTVASGSGYSVANSTVNETFNLPAGCYDFAITDSYGDGICCTYGNGSYTLASGGSTLATGGAYGSGETKNFCVGSTRMAAKKASGFELNLYPNPANANTTLRLFLEETSNVNVTLFDLQGRMVKSIAIENASGALETNIELSGLKSGIYLMSVATDSGIKQTRKLIVE